MMNERLNATDVLQFFVEFSHRLLCKEDGI